MKQKVVIELLTKSGSHFPGPIHYESEYIPRIGELIDAHQFLGLEADQIGNFIVISIIYKMTKDGFLPVVIAQQWYKGLRYQILEEFGWLTPVSVEPPDHSYDEDIYNTINI